VIGRNVAGLAPFASTGAYIVDGEITILGNGCGEPLTRSYAHAS